MELPILLHTKSLIPRNRSDYLPRPRLTQQLAASVQKRLTLISAPAGYGKTTLLAEFAASTDNPIAWYQLDPADGDPIVFLSYLIECLRRVQPEDDKPIGEAALALLNSMDDLPNHAPERITALLLNDLAELMTEEWIVVLEDYHLISNNVVHHLVDYLIDNAPPKFHLIISTRSTPPLSITRHRVHGILAEIGINDLRFQEDEVAALAADRGTAISEAGIQSLNDRTEGWVAGVQLVLYSLADKDIELTEDFITDLKGTNRYIFGYLVDEVLRSQPNDIQQFLLSTSMLAQMDATVCNALIDRSDGQMMLEYLEKNNLFIVSLDSNAEWYRYHYLFRESLMAKLRREQPQRLLELEHTAGQYYEEQGEYEVALTHYLHSGDMALAARMLSAFAPDYIERGRIEVLQRYLNSLPKEVLAQQPELFLYHGDVLRQIGQMGAAINRYTDALAAYERASDLTGQSHALIRLAELTRAQGDYHRAYTFATRALDHSPADDHALQAQSLMALARCEGFLTGTDKGRELAERALEEADKAADTMSMRIRATLLRSLGQMCWWHGDPQATVRHCRRALETVSGELSPVTAKIYFTLSTPYLYWRDHVTALDYAERGLSIAQELELIELLPRAYMVLGNVLARMGEVTRAENSLRQALEWADKLGGESYDRVMAVGTLAHDLCLQNRFDEAHQLAQSVLWTHAGMNDSYEMVVCRSVMADVALDLGELDRARDIFSPLLEIARRRQFKLPLAMIYFGLAYIYLKDDNAAEGLEMAKLSLELVEPTNAVQLYLDQGERTRLVCEALRESGIKSPFIDTVLESFPSAENRPILMVAEQGVIQISCLGRFKVVLNGEEITQERWVSTKARDLLAYFATFRYDRIPIDRALDSVWPDKKGRGKTAFHTALHRLRKALRQEGESTKFVLVEASEYLLDISRFQLDVDEFDSLLKKAQSVSNGESNPYYEAVLSLYDGDYLGNLYYDWLLPERRRLHNDYLKVLRSLTAYKFMQGSHEDTLALATRALHADPLAEEFHCYVMQSLAGLNNRAGVMRHYQELEMLLQDELATDPLPETIELYQSLINTGR